MTSKPQRLSGIVGVGMTRFKTLLPASFWDLIQEASVQALNDARMEPGDIDAVVFAQAPDPLHGLGHPEYTAPDFLPMAGKLSLRVHTGGATGASAVQMGDWLIRSGRARRVLVVGAEKMGDNVRGAQEVLNKIWDPPYESALPLNTITMTALQACRYLHQTDTRIEELASIAVRLRGNGVRNSKAHLRKPLTHDEVFDSPVLAHPLRLSMVCPRSSGACAVVMSDAEGAPSDDVAWVRGIAARTNTYFMGDKMGDCGPNDHGRQYETQLAAEDAYRQAGITDPAKQVDVAEPYVPFVTQEPMTLESLGLCEPGESVRLSEKGMWDYNGKLPVSPSGGVLCTNPISVSGMLRIAEAAQQVRRKAGDHQVDRADVAIGAGQGGSIQFSVVSVLGTTSSLANA